MDRTSNALAALTSLLAQDTRLIELDTALPGALVVERFEGSESVCADFKFDIDCLSTSAFLDAKALIAQPLSLRLRQADGSHRHWHGHCTRVAPLGSDGGLARYRLTLEPWTAFLKLRRNALVFQDLDALGVVERIFDDYPQASYRIDATQSLPVFPSKTQYRVSDHEFVLRLLAEAGLAWRFEHTQDAVSDDAADATGESASSHTLVIFDRDAEIVDGSPAVLRFHRIDATESLDAITHFTEQHQATPNAVTTASWQPERVESHAASFDTDPAGPSLPTREVYTAAQSGRFAERRHADLAAELQLDALRLPQRLHMGAGSARGLAAGCAFTLIQHPNHSGERFIPLTVEHVAANNLGSGIVVLLDNAELERGSYRNRFIAVTADTPIVPTARPKPTAPGLQTAIVVGLPDAAVTSTRDHQVRIQFPWQRGRTPNRGGLTDTGSSAHPDGHAPGDDTSGTWVRVSEWQAGPNWGSHALPRIGAEVLVDFQHGDIDQPLVIGQMYNGEVAPPFALAEASNHPGTVSGLHSQSLDGSGSQQWLMDDASGQLRQRLHTSLADSRLELGYLVEPNNASRGSLRGQGFDFATLGWANLRAGQGVLLSTTARANATSTQLDINEAVGQLKAAEQTAQSLSDAAAGSEVAVLSANAQQTKLISQLDAEQVGKYPGSVNGQSATKPAGSNRDGGDPVEKFAVPLLFVESPDAIALTTPKSALAYAGGNVHLTSQHDAHLTAGHTFAGVSGGHLALFAQHGPIKAIAANGPLTLQAHAGPLELLADQSVTITATDERVDVLAKQKIVLQAGQTQITLDGGDITFACPGNFTVKAGQHPFKGGVSIKATLDLLPSKSLQSQIICGLQSAAPPQLQTPALPAAPPPRTGPAPQGSTPPVTSGLTVNASGGTCASHIPAHATNKYSPLAGTKDYHETNAQGQKVLDTTVAPPRPIELNFSGAHGSFDASYSPLSSTIKASIKVKLNFVDWHRTDSAGNVLLDANGSPAVVPFDSDQESDVAIQTANIVEVSRAPNMAGASALKSRIESVLNQNRYKLVPATCAQGGSCACKIDAVFEVNFVTSGDHHAEVKMFPRVVRANSGSMGEVSVKRNPSPSAALLQPYLPTTIDNVGAHEIGHLFGWPDEYFLHGGAVNGRYIKPGKTVDIVMPEPADDWKRDSATNLMGQGMWTQSPKTPKYYMNHVRDWFNSKTGIAWGVSL